MMRRPRRQSVATERHSWIDLLQTSGPFLTVPVADQVWPAGLPAVPVSDRAGLRGEVARLLDSAGGSRPELARALLTQVLGWADALVEGVALPESLAELVVEHGVVLRPDFAFRDPTFDDADALSNAESSELDDPAEPSDRGDLGDEDDAPTSDDDTDAGRPGRPEHPWRLLGMWLPWRTHPLRRTNHHGWVSSPVERLAALLRARDVPVGLVGDGRWWALVHAPRGKPVGAAVWDASLWSEERESLEGFVALLERRRFLGVAAEDRLPELLERSGLAQEEVTNQLGAQVRESVEMLIRRLDDLDRSDEGRLLVGVDDDELYAGVVTVMMRVIFLLFAEERRLLPSDDERYDRGYSVGRLVEQLEERVATHGPQTLEHRSGAWHRLLALTRALHTGVDHQDLRLPPYGGAIFDPDRYPWLEGRRLGEVDRAAEPPAVDDLTVLRMLRAVQFVELQGERRRLTFRALDVEQIGYVYEGLLELEVRTAPEPALQLERRGGVDVVFVSDAIELSDPDDWVASTYLGKRKADAASRRRAERLLAAGFDVKVTTALEVTAASLDLDPEQTQRLATFAPLLRRDERDRPMVAPTHGRYVASSSRRASTGAHYTPRTLAEGVVQHALDPLVHRPGPLETLASEDWVIRPSVDLLDLRVADVAMGSGAFLVAACRYLADKLVEAWHHEGDTDATRAVHVATVTTADAEVSPVVLRARRLVAEHCLYGVDVNPLAVEMAKLSLWLITMDRERPFGFLDDRLVCGDTLLGLVSTDQLDTLHIDPVAGRRLHEGTFELTDWRELLGRAADARRRITGTSVITVRDVERKLTLLREAQEAAEPLREIADALTGAGLQAAALAPRRREDVFRRLYGAVIQYDGGTGRAALDDFRDFIDAGVPEGKERRRPLHWPLVFPEVFADDPRLGFDALIGNPPFLGGKKISGTLGTDYLQWLVAWDGRGKRGATDLAARFLLRAGSLLNARGHLGFVTTNSLTEGETLEVGLLQMHANGWRVRRGTTPHPWPSRSASLSIIEVWASRESGQAWSVMDDEPVPNLGPDLSPYLRETGRPEQLDENQGICFIGHYVLGTGFTLSADEAQMIIRESPRESEVLFPYVVGADLNRRPDLSASRMIVNFKELSEQRARQFPLAWNHVFEQVRPDRMKKNEQRYPRMVREWWKFFQYRQLMESKLSNVNHLLAVSLVGNVLAPVRVPSGSVFAHRCAVFALDDYASLSTLTSSAHQCWVIRYTSTLETRLNYSPSDVFVTFPRPDPTVDLHRLGEVLDTERRDLMLGRSLGLTKLYNEVHDPLVSDPAIRRLREIHADIDAAVLGAYGWGDLDLDIGHHPTKIGIRWTVSPDARFELLDRLLVLNHERAGVPTHLDLEVARAEPTT